MKKMIVFCLLVLFLISSPIIFAEETLQVPNPESIKSTTITTTYFYAIGKLVASKGSDGISYMHSNQLGSNRITTDSTGNKIGETKTLPFGEEIRNTGNDKFTFTEKELDGELYYFGARYYDSNIGRFTSVDAVKDNHPYTYVVNNPFSYIDDDGNDLKNLGAVSYIHQFTLNQNTGKMEEETIVGGDNGVSTLFVKIGEPTLNQINNIHSKFDAILEKQGIEIVGEYLSDISKSFVYADYRFSNYVTDKYDEPYKDGRPELFTMLEQGDGVCYEQAIFMGIALASYEKIDANYDVKLVYINQESFLEDGTTRNILHMTIALIPRNGGETLIWDTYEGIVPLSVYSETKKSEGYTFRKTINSYSQRQIPGLLQQPESE